MFSFEVDRILEYGFCLLQFIAFVLEFQILCLLLFFYYLFKMFDLSGT